METVTDLLARARAAGLTVALDGPTIVVRGRTRRNALVYLEPLHLGRSCRRLW
jgi:hypothetical protein